MTELVYHDGHYHRVSAERPGRRHDDANRHQQHSGGLWQKTYELWDHVLYGVASRVGVVVVVFTDRRDED
ncbi:hypothetical protein FALBO_10915 [Fusarium albosuccineum]|uniref:Uncharacterized protein n=1 Tax=Fusarium albosuccineum TaxID=1237068 RepID=A0A8H4L6W2_9HYPO|nr:hypothetical protein FALBO_10915 [Fusarium albosuccineum]